MSETVSDDTATAMATTKNSERGEGKKTKTKTKTKAKVIPERKSIVKDTEAQEGRSIVEDTEMQENPEDEVDYSDSPIISATQDRMEGLEENTEFEYSCPVPSLTLNNDKEVSAHLDRLIAADAEVHTPAPHATEQAANTDNTGDAQEVEPVKGMSKKQRKAAAKAAKAKAAEDQEEPLAGVIKRKAEEEKGSEPKRKKKGRALTDSRFATETPSQESKKINASNDTDEAKKKKKTGQAAQTTKAIPTTLGKAGNGMPIRPSSGQGKPTGEKEITEFNDVLNHIYSVASSRNQTSNMIPLTSKNIGDALKIALDRNPALGYPKGYSTLGKEVVLEFNTEEEVEPWLKEEEIDGGKLGKIRFRNPKTITHLTYLIKNTSVAKLESIMETVKEAWPGMKFKLYQVYEDPTGRGKWGHVCDWVVMFSEAPKKVVNQLRIKGTSSEEKGSWNSVVVAVTEEKVCQFCGLEKLVHHVTFCHGIKEVGSA